MATLYGGDITSLVCSTWNISDAPGRPAYPGGAVPITSRARHHTRPRTPAARPEPRHGTPGRCVAGSDPAAPGGPGLQPADTPRPRRSPPPASGGRQLSRQTPQRAGCFGPKQTPGVARCDGPRDQRIAGRKTRTQEGFTRLTHSSRISDPSPVWVATGLWMPGPRTRTARAKMAWASGIKPAF